MPATPWCLILMLADLVMLEHSEKLDFFLEFLFFPIGQFDEVNLLKRKAWFVAKQVLKTKNVKKNYLPSTF